MNIDSIKTYPAGSSAKYKHREYGVPDYRKQCVGMCDENFLNKGIYSGSFTGKNEAAAAAFNNLGNTFVDKIFRSGLFKSLLRVFEEKSVVASSLVALVVAGVARPLTNLSMAGKDDREDSIYAASHAIASAVIGFCVSSIVMAPFDKAFRKIKENPKDYLQGLEELLGVTEIGKRKLEKSKPYKKISKIAQFIPDSIVLGIPKAMLTIALIPPILKYVFHIEKGKHKKHPVPEKESVQVNKTKYVKNIVKDNSAFKAFEGGVK